LLKYGGKAMNKKGVTLLELIIVMVIIAIGATLMVPAIGSWIPHYRLRSATRDIVSTMRTAQMKAVSMNKDFQVRFLNTKSYILEYQTTSETCLDGSPPTNGWCRDGTQQNLPTGVEITSFPPNNRFLFNPNSTASTGSLTLKNSKNNTRTISLTTSTGRIEVEPPL